MPLPRVLSWKTVGLAGLVGVVATGVVVARDERQRRAYTADEVRSRLHQRLAEAPPEEVAPEPPRGNSWRNWWKRPKGAR